jgi:hypothetical protein
VNIFHLILLISGFGLIAVYEIPQMAKEHHWRDLMAFSIVLLAAFILSLLMFMRIDVPNPMKLVEAVVRSLRKVSLNLIR